MSNYTAKYEKQFIRNLRWYASLRQRIKRSVERVLLTPYNSEFPGDVSGKLNLLKLEPEKLIRGVVQI